MKNVTFHTPDGLVVVDLDKPATQDQLVLLHLTPEQYIEVQNSYPRATQEQIDELRQRIEALEQV